MEALLVGQESEGLGAAISLGSASADPTPEIMEAAGRASKLYAALDADPTGNEAASRWESHWPGRFERITPPAGKDWTEAHQKKIYLRGFWQEVFAGLHRLRERFPMATTHGLLTYSKIDWTDRDERPF